MCLRLRPESSPSPARSSAHAVGLQQIQTIANRSPFWAIGRMSIRFIEYAGQPAMWTREDRVHLSAGTA